MKTDCPVTCLPAGYLLIASTQEALVRQLRSTCRYHRHRSLRHCLPFGQTTLSKRAVTGLWRIMLRQLPEEPALHPAPVNQRVGTNGDSRTSQGGFVVGFTAVEMGGGLEGDRVAAPIGCSAPALGFLPWRAAFPQTCAFHDSAATFSDRPERGMIRVYLCTGYTWRGMEGS